MSERQAAVVSDEQFATVIKSIQNAHKGGGKHLPHERLRNVAMLFLTHKAALRACEVAGLRWKDVLDSNRQVGKSSPHAGDAAYYFHVPSSAAKGKKSRTIPMHPVLMDVLKGLYTVTQPFPDEYIIVSARSKPMSPNLVQKTIGAIYKRAGLYGCSSHSGRRTAITKLMRRIGGTTGTSIRDVQLYAGHADLGTTALYIEASPEISKLVGGL